MATPLSTCLQPFSSPSRAASGFRLRGSFKSEVRHHTTAGYSAIHRDPIPAHTVRLFCILFHASSSVLQLALALASSSIVIAAYRLICIALCLVILHIWCHCALSLPARILSICYHRTLLPFPRTLRSHCPCTLHHPYRNQLHSPALLAAT